MTCELRLSGGSVAGHDHRRMIPKNRQDDFFIMQASGISVAIVADGCGSGGLASRALVSQQSAGSSEVGASLGVRLLGNLIHRYFLAGYRCFDAAVLERIRRDLVAQLHVLASNMGQSLSEVVDRYFLFTLVGSIITDERAVFFALGDGVIVVNDQLWMLEPDEGNQPIYLGYALTGSSLTDNDPARLQFQIVTDIPTSKLSHFLIGTDGLSDLMAHDLDMQPGMNVPVGPISQFWLDDLYLTNRAAIERKLNLVARDWQRHLPDGTKVLEPGLLHDDTTLVVGRYFDERG